MTDDTPGGYLCSDQGDEIESQILAHISEAKKLLESLTFEISRTGASDERVRDTALLQCQALWRTIYYTNGS